MRGLDGRVVIVTGAASGIGRATAAHFAQEGALVVMNDRSAERLDAAAEDVAAVGPEPLAVPGDVTDRDVVFGIVETARTHHGRLDVIHNNAGGTMMFPLTAIPEDRYRRFMALNLDAVFWGCQAALRVMVEQGSGVIINTSSVMGVLGDSMVAAYGAAKAAVLNLTRCVAIEYAGRGIRANAVIPGAIDTEGNRRGLEAAPPGTRERLERVLPMGRMGLADEVANAVVFLASDEASYISGAALPVDGGQSARLYTPDLAAP